MKSDIREQIRAAIKADRQRIASAGGQARAKSLTASERKRIATKGVQGCREGENCESQDKTVEMFYFYRLRLDSQEC